MDFESRNPYAQIRFLWRVILGLVVCLFSLAGIVVWVDIRHNRDVRALILERCD